jgi:hypothetical protein
MVTRSSYIGYLDLIQLTNAVAVRGLLGDHLFRLTKAQQSALNAVPNYFFQAAPRQAP